MMFDSDVLIWATRGNLDAAALIDSIPDRCMSIVSVMEILQGARSLADMRIVKQSLKELRLRVLPLSERTGYIASALIEEHAMPHGLRVGDALIAATAIEAGEVLTTCNARHFRPIRRLEVKDFHPQKV
jgi:predicted nucleic acid-binding protein